MDCVFMHRLSSVGLDDMVLSALVKEQIEGLTPATMALIPPRKLAVRASHTPHCITAKLSIQLI